MGCNGSLRDTFATSPISVTGVRGRGVGKRWHPAPGLGLSFSLVGFPGHFRSSLWR